MGAGARMAAERDRWPDHWRVADLEIEEEGVLDLLQDDEELVAVVPGMRSTPDEGDSQVLIAVTNRRVVVVGRTRTEAVDLVIEGHGNVNTFQGMRAYGEFMRALVSAAKDGLARKVPTDQALVTLEKNPKFAVFLKNELLKDLEYGDTPRNRALINLNVAYQELRGDPVTSYFGPAQPIGPEKGSGPPARGGGAGRGGAPGGRGAPPAGPGAPPAPAGTP